MSLGPTLFDNAEVRRQRSRLIRARTVFGVAVLTLACHPVGALPVAVALREALQGTQASAVVLDMRGGGVLVKIGAQRRGAPGSTIKPLLLAYALEHGIVHPDMEVYCRRDLHVGRRALPCTHPADEAVFTAENALAESCNTWFAEMGRRFSGPALETALEATHLSHSPMNAAGVEQRQLVALGLSGVTASPLELARAYRDLLGRLLPTGTVERGLRSSVEYGMAHSAAVAGVPILGKTGTASDPGEAWTHGWFVGAIPGRLLLVVYVAHGDGGTAAQLGQIFFRGVMPNERSR